MHHWDRNSARRLERSSAPQEQSYEVSIHSGQMEPPPKEQQSQQGVHKNPNAYRSMRDHIHPPRVSAPSCIMPPPEDIIIKPYIVPLLLTFHGLESENPYSHIHTHTFRNSRKYAIPLKRAVGHDALKACNLYCFMETIFYI